MQQFEKLLTPADRQRINEAVAAAEAQTSAEIVPVVALASGRYDRPEDVVGLWAALVALAATWSLLPGETHGEWAGLPGWAHLVLLLLSVAVGFVIGAGLGMRVDWLRSLFTPDSQKHDEVLGRARQVFFDARAHHTSGRTGLLIYISLFERRAAVLGDQAILEHLGSPAIDELRDELTASLKIKNHSLADALCEVISAAGPRLAEALPPGDANVNQLPDALQVLDRP